MHQAGEDGITELLDGQQRLATATILFSVLRDVAETLQTSEAKIFSAFVNRDFIIGENGVRRLQLGDLDDSYFSETIQSNKPSDRKPSLRTHRNIKAARMFLEEMVKASIAGKNAVSALQELTRLKNILRDDLVMTCITVASDGNAFQIFETLNDRGLKLSIPDLLLNYLMRKAPTEDRKLIRASRDEMLTAMGSKYNIEKFIRHLWVSKYGDIKKTTFGVMKAKIEDKSNPIRSLDFVRMCASECSNYISLLSHNEESLGPAAPVVKSLLQSFNSNAPLPMLLSAHAVFDSADLATIARLSLVFMVRSAGLLGDSSTAETVFFPLARELRALTDDNVKKLKLKDVKEKLRNAAPTDEQITASADKMFLKEDCAEYIVRRLADAIESTTKERATHGEEAHLEHIYPQSPHENEWGGEHGQLVLDPYLMHIGNLVMLGKRLNGEAGNSEYPKKVEVYKRSALEAVKELVRSYPDRWDKDTIESRARNLVPRILIVWNFDNPSRV